MGNYIDYFDNGGSVLLRLWTSSEDKNGNKRLELRNNGSAGYLPLLILDFIHASRSKNKKNANNVNKNNSVTNSNSGNSNLFGIPANIADSANLNSNWNLIIPSVTK